MQTTQPHPQQPSPHTARTQAVRTAAQAVDAHVAAPDTVTLHTMQDSVQTALNLGATPTDIRDARDAVNA